MGTSRQNFFEITWHSFFYVRHVHTFLTLPLGSVSMEYMSVSDSFLDQVLFWWGGALVQQLDRGLDVCWCCFLDYQMSTVLPISPHFY